MEFQEPAKPDENSFDQIDLGSSSSGTEGAGNLEALGAKVAGANLGMPLNSSRNRKVNSFIETGSS